MSCLLHNKLEVTELLSTLAARGAWVARAEKETKPQPYCKNNNLNE
jgi:hypothetical protein